MFMHYLWGDGKPIMSIFLADFVAQMNSLSEEGFVLWESKDFTVRVKVEVFCFTCDAPAKAAVLSHVGVTGFHACVHCWAKGVSISTSAAAEAPPAAAGTAADGVVGPAPKEKKGPTV